MKTKIVATIGPASSSKEMLLKLALAGVDVFRLNFSHSTHQDHLAVIQNIKEINSETNLHLAILADLQGPKIRIGIMENGQAMLEDGHELVFTTDDVICTADRLSITYPQFPADVREGEDILLDDGKIMLRVLSTNGKDEVKAKVIHGGILSSKKGINLPNTNVSLPSLSIKDRSDLDFALDQGVNWVALSFVRSAHDIRQLRKQINEHESGCKPGIIAKIEKPEAVRNMDSIIAETDGLMVARGDLGVELPLEQVPIVQKTLAEKCNKAGKPIIIATQMMEGMITNIRPTRAEVNDVANSVLDGADALMLSGETSVGQFPEEVVQTMQRIINYVESNSGIYDRHYQTDLDNKERLISDAILRAACEIASETGAQAIIAMTRTGYSAMKISSQRPRSNIFIFTDNRDLLCKLNLVWGIKGVYFDEKIISTSKTLQAITNLLKSKGMISQGDLLVNVASSPIYVSGLTNTVKLSYA